MQPSGPSFAIRRALGSQFGIMHPANGLSITGKVEARLTVLRSFCAFLEAMAHQSMLAR
jgi:hypothetical protein